MLDGTDVAWRVADLDGGTAMSVRTASEQMAGAIGTELASSTDEVQAEFLNAFARQLHTSCHGDPDMQLCYIERHLNRNARNMVKALAEFVTLGEEADR